MANAPARCGGSCHRGAILEVYDPTMLVDGMQIWTERHKVLLAEQETLDTVFLAPRLSPPTSAAFMQEGRKAYRSL